MKRIIIYTRPVTAPILALILFIGIFLLTSTTKVNAAFPGNTGRVASNYFYIDQNSGSPLNNVSDINYDGTDRQILHPISFNGFGDVMILGAPRYSSDGEKITYTSQTDNGLADIYISNADGSNVQNVTSLTDSDFPENLESGGTHGGTLSSFHPNSDSLVYTQIWQENDSRSRIMSINTDGTNNYPLTQSSGQSCDFYPIYSPDGSKIAFLRTDRVAETHGIYLMNADGGDQHEILRLEDNFTSCDQSDFYSVEQGFTTIDWSPDGQNIVFSTGGDLNVGNSIGITDLFGNSSLVYSPTPGSNEYIRVNQPQYTPEGQIVFRFGKIIIIDDEIISGEGFIQVINTDGTGLQTIDSSSAVGDNGYYIALFMFLFPSVQPTQHIDLGDSDPIPDSVEDAAPGNGDGNNDGTPDSEQSNVTSLPIPSGSNAGTYVTLVVPEGSTITSTAIDAVASMSSKDIAYSYPLGLVSFTATTTIGATVPIELYFHTDTTASSFIARKYNTNNQTYTTLSTQTQTSLTQTIINTKPVLKLSYQLTDGGPLDQDGVANGTIVDPVGLAQASVGVPDTGL